MKLVDSNVFIYAVGRPHPYRDACRKVAGDLEAGSLLGNVNTEVFQEILNVYRGRQEVARGVQIARDLMLAFPMALVVNQSTIRSAIEILAKNPALQSRDAIHVATVFEYNLEGIISTDRGFDSVAGLKRFDPKELAA